MNIKKPLGNRILLAVVILIQLGCVLYLCANTRVAADGIFTYTLANTPYEFNYIGSKITQFPGENGWFDAYILKEQFMTMSYDRFNWSGVYWHQRLDNHPLLYYSLVHMVCSLFPESYSVWYALSINIVALLLIDLILFRLAGYLFPENREGSAALMIAAATSIVSICKLGSLTRMYMLLALMCVWALWICIRLARETRVCLWEVYLCVLLGTQTHYYYYVYAGLTAFLTMVIMMHDRAWLRLWRTILAAGCGFLTSLIVFPWVVWHIIFNQMDKNTSLHMWSLQELQSYLAFVNRTVFNSRGLVWVLAAVAVILLALLWRTEGTALAGGRRVWLVIGLPTLLFSVTIYTLNGDVYYYATPVYLPMAILMSLAVLTICNAVQVKWTVFRRPVVAALVCVAAMVTMLGGVSTYTAQAVATRDAYQAYLPFHQVAEDYVGADCLYVSSDENDNLLSNLWFEFADYDEFRKVTVEDYEAAVADDLSTLLVGRESENPVVIYATIDKVLPNDAAELASDNGWKIAVIYE